ncbi:hypothetical protein [Aquimarina sp. SS2-1]|uniref:hypothetical protein n=1 Tax=Aquimarina besae TaxID=3342247 RepID=UPI0036707E90
MSIIKTTFILICFIGLIVSFNPCKNSTNEKVELKESSEEISKNTISQSDQEKTKISTNDFQGFWESFSEYLEHESAFKDYNSNKYYKVVSGHKSLNIKLIKKQINNSTLNQNYLGFLNTITRDLYSQEQELVDNLKTSGDLLVRFEKGLENYNKSNVEVSNNFNRYFDVTEIFEDGFDYDEKDKKISFRLISSLPMEIFKVLKTKSDNEGFDYIKEFAVEKQSKKIKVISDKTFFHNGMSSATKRKAFLVKGDIAYLEAIQDDWVKVYYDGKTVSGGFIKRSDIEILK